MMRGATSGVAALLAATVALALPAFAAGYPVPKEGSWTVRDFPFQDGEILAEVKLAYRTVGEPSGAPVLFLHDAGVSGASLLTPEVAGQLFGPGQPLDATKYYVIIPDSLGHGRSSKPSDGLGTRFPKYGDVDMVVAQYLLVTEHFGLERVRMVVGHGMGGTHASMWAKRYPGAVDIAMPVSAKEADARSDKDAIAERLRTAPRSRRGVLPNPS